jgi:hypothetical protein
MSMRYQRNVPKTVWWWTSKAWAHASSSRPDRALRRPMAFEVRIPSAGLPPSGLREQEVMYSDGSSPIQ